MVQRPFPTRIFRGFSSYNKARPSTEIHDIEIVKRDLLNHFYTRRGERVMRPQFGTIIWDLLFEPFDEIVRDQILSDVDHVISSEPRVELISSDVTEFEHGLRIDVQLKYIPFESVGMFSLDFDRRNGLNSNNNVSIEEI